MATIPVQATGLRHVRKTVTLDGGANNGNLGDIVPLFTLTGRVLVVHATAYVSVALACTAPTATSLWLWVVGGGNGVSLLGGGNDWTGTTGLATGYTPDPFGSNYGGWAASANIGIYVYDDGGGADVTAGTIIVDAWYYPITNDGALAGDDIDTELGAYLADKVLDEALSGHTTAGSLGKAVADVEVDTSTTLQAELDGIQADTEDIQARLPAALVGGRIDATIDATGMESGAIDAILTRTMTEAYAAAGAEMTVAQALYEICQVFSEFAISGSTITVKQRDGSTTAMTFTLDSAIQPTSRTRAT